MPQGRIKEPRHCQEHDFITEDAGEWGMHRRWYHGDNPKPWPPKLWPPKKPPKQAENPVIPPAKAWIFQWRPAHTTRKGLIETKIHGLSERREAEAFLKEDIANGVDIIILNGSPIHA